MATHSNHRGSLGICLLGCGTIGTGVVRIIHEQRDLIAQRTGLNLELRHIVERDPAKTPTFAQIPIHPDAERAIDDPKTDIVIELIGGTDVAAKFVERALRLGKPVVTANKSLLAAQGAHLFALARKHNACIGFEASCGGGIPIIAALTRDLVANRIDALIGIVNGTCNFVLTQMTRNGWSYAQALTEAQKLGFAEANPVMDVSGRDSAQKLSILAGLAFNAQIAESNIYLEGIDKLQDADIKFAGELGYIVKLLAIARRHGSKISLRVHPTLIKRDDLLADVNGSFNAISVYGHALGHALFYGRGAGQTPTASAVVADVVNVALGVTPLAFRQLNIFPDQVPPADVLAAEEFNCRYYLRLMARDEPGVLAQVTRILGENGISLSAILQHETSDGRVVPVVITTHLAREGSVQAALKEIDKLQAIAPPTVCLRILDQPKEFAGG
ncbi:MAG TPA: homoserine dehydrogenase [Tepidisphaeraceae bacterium]|jgi:homoserine dehydrogenase|nr:homoserine dehydrogenase [Tepidisphaeraceae bacterium]